MTANTHHSSLITHHSDAPASADMPTVSRIRARLAELNEKDITMAQAVWVFGVSTQAPIQLRIQRGEISGAKVMGEWLIDTASINNYLDKINQSFNRTK